jgi:hypothetical protein
MFGKLPLRGFNGIRVPNAAPFPAFAFFRHLLGLRRGKLRRRNHVPILEFLLN